MKILSWLVAGALADLTNNDRRPPQIQIPVYVASLASSTAARERFQRQAAHARLVHLQFMDAVDARDVQGLRPWMDGESLDHLASRECPEALSEAAFKVANYASNMRALERIASGAVPGIFFEDDAVLQPNPERFGSLLSILLRHLNSTRGHDGWDVVLLGSCYEKIRHIREGCECVVPRREARLTRQPGLYLTLPNTPLCTHAMLFSPGGAKRMHRLLRPWGRDFWVRSRSLNLTRCAAAADRHDILVLEGLHKGHDVLLRNFTHLGQLRMLEVWPQLALQESHIGNKHHTYPIFAPFPCIYHAFANGICGAQAFLHDHLHHCVHCPWNAPRFSRKQDGR